MKSPLLPKSVVLLRYVGIGDLIWHLPYIRAIASQSRNSKVSVIAAPSTLAKDILAAEDCIEHVLYYDRNPRRKEGRRGGHRGFWGMLNFSKELKKHNFDRIYIFSCRYHHAALAWLAKIPYRAGFGTNIMQRLFLNKPPYIKEYVGPGVAVFEDATSFVLAHNIVKNRAVPKMLVPQAEIETGRKAISNLPHPVIAFSIGTSKLHKHWGNENYSILANTLIEHGYGVAILGGPNEREVAMKIVDNVSANNRLAIKIMTENTILQSAGVLRAVDLCVGNDTGILQMAAANDIPTICILGNRPLLLHDPLINCILDSSLSQIRPDRVLSEIEKTFATR